MNELALFAGAGGGLLASRLLGWRTVCAVEHDAYCVNMLMQRQQDGALESFPIWDDVRTFDGSAWRGCVDVISAGFPCQPFSVAGKQLGDADERNMWPDTIRIIREVGPRFAFLENVPGLMAHEYFGQILGDMAEAGFDAEWCVLGADDVGAPHRRKRLWIVAHSESVHRSPVFRDESDGDSAGGGLVAYAEEFNGDGCAIHESCDREGGHPFLESRERDADATVADAQTNGWYARWPSDAEEVTQRRQSDRSGSGSNMAAAEASRLSGGGRPGSAEHAGSARRDWWSTEPDVGRVADGVASRVDRLRAIGNGQVPSVAALAWRLLRSG